MKTNYLKSSILMVAALTLSTAVKAQDSTKQRVYVDRYNNYDHVDNKTPGKLKEHIQTNWDEKTYQIELVNNKMTSLSVEGEKIPPAKWGEYSTVVAAIREQ